MSTDRINTDEMREKEIRDAHVVWSVEDLNAPEVEVVGFLLNVIDRLKRVVHAEKENGRIEVEQLKYNLRRARYQHKQVLIKQIEQHTKGVVWDAVSLFFEDEHPYPDDEWEMSDLEEVIKSAEVTIEVTTVTMANIDTDEMRKKDRGSTQSHPLYHAAWYRGWFHECLNEIDRLVVKLKQRIVAVRIAKHTIKRQGDEIGRLREENKKLGNAKILADSCLDNLAKEEQRTKDACIEAGWEWILVNTDRLSTKESFKQAIESAEGK